MGFPNDLVAAPHIIECDGSHWGSVSTTPNLSSSPRKQISHYLLFYPTPLPPRVDSPSSAAPLVPPSYCEEVFGGRVEVLFGGASQYGGCADGNFPPLIVRPVVPCSNDADKFPPPPLCTLSLHPVLPFLPLFFTPTNTRAIPILSPGVSVSNTVAM